MVTFTVSTALTSATPSETETLLTLLVLMYALPGPAPFASETEVG